MKKNILCPLLFMLTGNICLAQNMQSDPAAAPDPVETAAVAAPIASEESLLLKSQESAKRLQQTETSPAIEETQPSGISPAQTDAKTPVQKEEKTPVPETQEKKRTHQQKDMDTVSTKNQPAPMDTRHAAMERRSRQARILANLAIDLMAHENHALAEKKLHEALQIDPNLASAYCNLALFDWRAGNREAAFMNIETCFMKGFRDFSNIEEDTDFGEIVTDRRYEALKRRYQ